MKKKYFIALFSFIFFVFQGLFAGDMTHSRRMRIARTQFFDIIYCEESLYTANLIRDHADELYQKAYDAIHAEYTFRIPIVISPDSDVLKISYSPSPYNRIIVFEGAPDKDLSCFEDSFFGLLYHEILKAVSISVRSKKVQKLKNLIGTDSLQPVSLISLPFSFAEGFSFINEGEGEENGRFNDGYFLQLLSQAKLEDKFPTWMQVSVNRSSYPGRDYSLAAGAAFIAYLQSRYGMEKFYEFWSECSKLHFFKFTSGIIQKVYGERISVLWDDFKEAVPLPDDLYALENLALYTKDIFEFDIEGLYKDVLSTKYGLVWYDDIRHEVDIFDPNGSIKIRRLLFLASDVNRLSVSPDGRFLSISFVRVGNREQFKSEVTWIYDLQTRSFLEDSFDLREGNIIQLSDNTYAVAGIDVKEKYAQFKVFRCGTINRLLKNQSENPEVNAFRTGLVYTRTFDYNIVVSSPVYAGKGKVAAIVNDSNQRSIIFINLEDETEQTFQIQNKDGKVLKIRELHFLDEEKTQYSFSFVPEGENAFTRMGYINLSKDYELEKVFLQKKDVDGGINSPTLLDDYLYYAAYKSEYNRLRSIPFNIVPFEEGTLVASEEDFPEYFEREYLQIETARYNPINYWFHGTFIPFVAVREISLSDGPIMRPGLGLSFLTNSDPLLNTDMVFSGSGGFLKLYYDSAFSTDPENAIKLSKGLDNFNNNWAFTVYVKNTSTPVDISTGTMFSFDPAAGTYTGLLSAVTAWSIPMGMIFRSLKMDIQSRLRYSTEYYDSNKVDEYPSLKDWPAPDKVYRDLFLQSNVTYSNIHQYGRSPFEKRGISISTFLTAIWDLNAADKKVGELKAEKIANGEDANNVNSIPSSTAMYFSAVDLMNFGLSAEVDIPRLTPLRMHKGLVLSVPSTIKIDVFKDIGTALKLSGDILVFGVEINQGVPFLLTYFSRVGIKTGYTGAFEYDTKTVNNPSFLDYSSFMTAFAKAKYNDYISVRILADFIPVIGKLTEMEFNTTFEFDFYITQPGFKFAFFIDFRY